MRKIVFHPDQLDDEGKKWWEDWQKESDAARDKILNAWETWLVLRTQPPKLVVPEVITSDFVYSRLRKDDYSVEERQDVAARVEQLLGKEKDVYVFFKHEETPAGALYAEELLQRFPEASGRKS